MLIFLDFDGVLHAHGDLPFARAEAFEAFVLARPGVEVVIASSWRETLSMPVLLDLFSDAFRHRIVGITPVLDGVETEYADGSGTFIDTCGVRQREVEAYLAAHDPNRPWVALDDIVELYAGTDRLIHVPHGLDEAVFAELDHHIRAGLGQPVLPALAGPA